METTTIYKEYTQEFIWKHEKKMIKMFQEHDKAKKKTTFQEHDNEIFVLM